MLRGLMSPHGARKMAGWRSRAAEELAMYTVCPKCALRLAVTAADLRAGQGYVRCGRCANVFNALLRLSEESSPDTFGPIGPATLIDPELDRASATMSRPALIEPVLAESPPEEPESEEPEPEKEKEPPPPAPAQPLRMEPEF